jgi:deaminated glutathione amidase
MASMANPVHAQLVQMQAPATHSAGMQALESWFQTSFSAGHSPSLVVTPEGTNLLQRDKAKFAATAPYWGEDDTLERLGTLAKRFDTTLVIGSALFQVRGGKAVNRSLVFGPDGALLAHYDKIHLFDVNLGTDQDIRESDTYTPGDRAVIVDTPCGKIGLTICYDVRFPHLYRDLAKAGAQIITVPAAFTVPTGQAHWHALLKARAIETGAFILAPAQGGQHEDGRQTFGHTLYVHPWGQMFEIGGDQPATLSAFLDLDEVAEARGKIPALTHDRTYQRP